MIVLFMSLTAVVMQGCSRPLEPQESCNFVQNPEQQRVSWGQRLPIKFYLHRSIPEAAYSAIDFAINEYNRKLGGGREILRIIARGVDGPLEPRKDGYSTLYWFEHWDPTRPNEQARTTIHWQGDEIFEADIRINADGFSYLSGENKTDLASLMIHEFGHALGLGHSVSHGSVMSFTLSEGEIRRELSDVDLANLRCEY